jgi:hypothetical protein
MIWNVGGILWQGQNVNGYVNCYMEFGLFYGLS